MIDSPLEMIARQYNNVVQYDAQGNPSIFAKFPKVKSSDLDPSLPEHTHPAFVIGGQEEDTILIGKYKNAELSEDGTLFSLPNLPPRVSMTYDEHLARMRAAGNGASGLTIADHGLMVLMAHKRRWFQHGNNAYGSCLGAGLHSEWYDDGHDYVAGVYVTFRGWYYQCLTHHKSSIELRPDKSPGHWIRRKQVGGTLYGGTLYEDALYGNFITLNGSGPLEWYLFGDITGPCDVVGNCTEMVYGLRLVNCEIQILGDNNDAADAEADISPYGTWKAILPSKTGNDYTLVNPGTSGTVHYVTDQNGEVMLDTVEPEFSDDDTGFSYFKDIKVNTANMPYVPSILYELGLAPIPGTTVHGTMEFNLTREEQLPRRAGYTGIMSSGMAYLDFYERRTTARDYCGSRARSRMNP